MRRQPLRHQQSLSQSISPPFIQHQAPPISPKLTTLSEIREHNPETNAILPTSPCSLTKSLLSDDVSDNNVCLLVINLIELM